jgi:hypothetical protein
MSIVTRVVVTKERRKGLTKEKRKKFKSLKLWSF